MSQYPPETTNEDRAGWANHALAHYQSVKQCGDEDHDTIVQDLITDLLHTLEDEDADRLVELALGHYKHEHAGGE